MQSVYSKLHCRKNKNKQRTEQHKICRVQICAMLTQTESRCRDRRVERMSVQIGIKLSRNSGMSKFDGCVDFVTVCWISVTVNVLECLTARCRSTTWQLGTKRRDDGHLSSGLVKHCAVCRNRLTSKKKSPIRIFRPHNNFTANR